MTEDDVRRIVREELAAMDRVKPSRAPGPPHTWTQEDQNALAIAAFRNNGHRGGPFVCGVCGDPAQGWNLVDLARGRRNVPGGVEYHCREAAD